MENRWRILGLGLVFLSITACSSNTDKTPTEIPQTPCVMTPQYLPHNAMGKLGIQVIRTGDDVKIILPSDNIFVVNSAEIQTNAYPALNKLASYLKSNGQAPIQVTGFTDELGLPVDNKWMAEQQARSVIAFLWTRGVNHCILMPVGAGEDQSVASNRYIAGSMANRRVEITFRAAPKLFAMPDFSDISNLF